MKFQNFPRGSVIHDMLSWNRAVVYRYKVTPHDDEMRLERVCNGWRDTKTNDVYPTLDSAKEVFRAANPLVGKLRMEHWRDGELISQAERTVKVTDKGHNMILDVTI